MKELSLTLFSLLSMPCWTYKEIMLYDTKIKSKATAIKVKNRAIKEFDGSVSYGTQYVKTDSVLSLYGTNREKELNLLKELVNEEELHKTNI